MSDISEYHLSHLLIDKFKSVGLDRTFGSLTIQELKAFSEDLIERIKERENKVDEPPF